MIDNVYALVEGFYNENPACEKIFSQELVERYLRQRAWQGESDEKLRQLWSLLELFLSYIKENELGNFTSLSIFDYQEIIYRYKDLHEDFELEPDAVHKWLEMTYKIFSDLGDADLREGLENFLKDLEDSLYVSGNFLMPPRRSKDDFFKSLEGDEAYDEKKIHELNQALDKLLNKVSLYFKRPKYARDLDRALRIFCGPNDVPPLSSSDDETEELRSFRISFWDYFMFDYHLLADDQTLLEHYFQKEHEHLSTMEQDLLRDLLHARFIVFEVTSVEDEAIICRDLFTGEVLELPPPDMALVSFEQAIFFGHIRTRGVLLLNYVSSVPATKLLRQRMREIILRLYELFKLQEKDASLDEFFLREAAAVRHIISLMAGYAQLNVVPLREMPREISRLNERIENFIGEKCVLCDLVQYIGLSQHAVYLIEKLFEDALSVMEDEQTCRNQISALMTAVLLLFIKLNGYDFAPQSDMFEIFGSNEKETTLLLHTLKQRLQLSVFDPRYLTEDGFVLSLYIQPEDLTAI